MQIVNSTREKEIRDREYMLAKTGGGGSGGRWKGSFTCVYLRICKHSLNVEKKGWWLMMQSEVNVLIFCTCDPARKDPTRPLKVDEINKAG